MVKNVVWDGGGVGENALGSVAGKMTLIQCLVIDTFLWMLYEALGLYKIPPNCFCSLYSSLSNLACGIVLFKLY